MKLPNLHFTVGQVRVEWAARFKSLEILPTGAPILSLLCSGTTLDAASYDYEGIQVLGEKVSPELLATMCEQAKGGTVYLLENHSASLRMGVSVDAHIDVDELGNQWLYVDFELNAKNPDVQFFLDEIRAGYIPQCSIGVFVRRVIAWDDAEGGYVGILMEGRFEHVALTRPDHAAFPPARINAVYAAGKAHEELREEISAALKTLPRIPMETVLHLEKSRRSNSAARKNAGAHQEGDSMTKRAEPANGARLKPELEAVAKELAQKAEAAADPEPDKAADGGAAAADSLKEADAPKEGEATKADDAEKAEAESKDDVSMSKAEADACKDDAEKAEGADAEKDAPITMSSIRNHVAGMRDMVKDAIDSGADPKDVSDLIQDMYSDFQALVDMLDAAGAEGEEDGEGDGEPEKEADAEADPAKDEDAPADGDEKPEPEPPAKKDPPEPPPAKKEDIAASKAKPAAAKPTRTEKQKAALARLKDRMEGMGPLRDILKEVREIRKENKEIKTTLEHLDSDEPVTPRARRFSSDENGIGEPKEGEDILEFVKSRLTNPEDRAEVMRKLATASLQKRRGGNPDRK